MRVRVACRKERLGSRFQKPYFQTIILSETPERSYMADDSLRPLPHITVKELNHFPNPKKPKQIPVPFHEARHATNFVCGLIKKNHADGN